MPYQAVIGEREAAAGGRPSGCATAAVPARCPWDELVRRIGAPGGGARCPAVGVVRRPHRVGDDRGAEGACSDRQPIPVIIDCDTGVDDALALLFAVRHPGLDLRAVTCVAGNTDVDGVVRNTLTVLEQAGAGDIPVARGRRAPLIEPCAFGRARARRGRHGRHGAARLHPSSGRRGRGDPAAPRDPGLSPSGHPDPDRAADEHRAAAAHVPGGDPQHRADRVHGRRGDDRERHAGRGVQRVARPGGGGGPAHRRGADHDVRAGRVQAGPGPRGGRARLRASPEPRAAAGRRTAGPPRPGRPPATPRRPAVSATRERSARWPTRRA